MAALARPECVDFLQFQEILRKMRLFDDTIIYALNVRLPTESFKDQTDGPVACKELFGQLETNYKSREDAIKRCLEYSASQVAELKDKKAKEESNVGIIKELRKEQNKYRLLLTEQGVEEIIRERTNKVFYERCRSHYIPTHLNH